MSLPPWKQALLHRRKKQEDEQKKRRTEEDAQLASLPPWKRALLLKQREKKEKEAGVASKEVAVERSDSFSKWKNQTQKKSEETRPPWVKKATANAPRTGGSISTAGRSYSVGSKPTTTTTRNSSNATSSPQVQKRVRRESVTVVPDPEDTPILLAFKRTNSPEPGSPSLVRSLGPISLRKKKQEPVNIKEKRRSFEDHDDKFASMPAWKKALILRRRAEASKQESQEKQDEQDGLEQKEKKPQAIAECQPAKQEGKTSVPLERKPDMAAVQRGNEPSREAEERDTSTVSQERPRTYSSPAASKRSAPPRPASRPAPTRTAPRPPPASSAPNAPPTPPTSKAPPKSITPKISQTATAPKTIPTSTAPKASSTASQKATHATKISASSRSRPAPEIVNRKEAENAASNKLVQQEGVTLHAPVFKEVDQWANVSQDDPKFKNLPSWKQALILRRRADIAKRTGSTSSSRTPSPVQPLSEEGHVKTAWSPRNSFDEAKSPNVPLWKQEFLKKKQSAGDSGMGKKQEKESSSKQKNISSARSPIKGGNVKALLGKFNQGGSGASTFSTNKPNLSHPSAPSRHTLQITSRSGSEDVSSNSSDEELEEIPLTNIDEVSTDEEDDDDSGISAGGSIPKTGSPEHSRPANRTLEFSNEPNKPSILSVPVKKPQKGLRRVSFSDSQLVLEHVYPKYDYSDYEEIDHDKEDRGWSETDGGNANENSGLSHKLHPSLRPTDTNSADPYGYSSPSPPKTASYRYNSPSPTNKHNLSDSDLQHYTPSILSSYGDALQKHFSGDTSSPLHNGLRENASPTAESSDDVMPATEEQTSDFYATLNSDAAAMLW